MEKINLGVTFEGAQTSNVTVEQFKAAERERLQQEAYRQSQENLARAQAEANARQVEQQRIDAEVYRQRLQEEAAKSRGNVPLENQPQGKSTLPYYMAPESVARMGFSPTTLAAIHPTATAIGYPDEAANQKERAVLGDNSIPVYKADVRIVRASVNPDGADGFGRAHTIENEPEGKFHFPKNQMQRLIEDQIAKTSDGMKVSMIIKKVLALPESKEFVSDAAFVPGEYQVEISFAVTGAEQITEFPAPDVSENVNYSNTRPIEGILNWLRERAP